MVDKIYEVIAFLNEDEDGNEGIVAMYSPVQNAWMPMVMTNRGTALSAAISHAQEIARTTKRPIKVVRFVNRREVTVLEP